MPERGSEAIDGLTEAPSGPGDVLAAALVLASAEANRAYRAGLGPAGELAEKAVASAAEALRNEGEGSAAADLLRLWATRERDLDAPFLQRRLAAIGSRHGRRAAVRSLMGAPPPLRELMYLAASAVDAGGCHHPEGRTFG